MALIERHRCIVDRVGDDAPCSGRFSSNQAPMKGVDEEIGSKSVTLMASIDCQSADEKEWNLIRHPAPEFRRRQCGPMGHCSRDRVVADNASWRLSRADHISTS